MNNRRIHYLYLGLILGLVSLAAASRPENSSVRGNPRMGSMPFAQMPAPPVDSNDLNARYDLPAEQVFKNIQLFKGVSARELLGTMDFMKASLGVNCGFCHVSNDFASDDKPAKKTARAMVLMARDINARNFGVNTVTCYTCHGGHPEPYAVPPLAGDLWHGPDTRHREPVALTETTVDQVLARYVQALGGETALRGVNTRVLKGTQTQPNGPAIAIESFQKAPDRLVTTAAGEKGAITEGYDGRTVWSQNGRRSRVLLNDEREQVRRAAEFFPALDLKSRYRSVQLLGKDTVGDRQFYLLSAMAADSTRERLYFDTKSGLLAHRYVEHTGLLGSLPFSIDYDDYRPVDKVAVPFKIHWTTPEQSWTEIRSDVRHNVTVDEAKFAMPPSKP
jgi:hypothetical protein